MLLRLQILLWFVFQGLVFAFVQDNQNFLGTQEVSACPLLNFQLPHLVSFPNSELYNRQSKSYWALNQAELASFCRVTPETTEDVQKILYLLSQQNSTFAIKSGGHSPVANTSNVANGVVIDLSELDHVTVHLHTETNEPSYVDIGAGARWQSVYKHLDELPGDYAVAGARMGSVGVSGYLLGGGLSVFSSSQGWACDNVKFFEVVLANGTILECNENNNQDLFQMLKGGGSNFGLVTRIGMPIMPYTLHHFAFLQYSMQHLNEVLGALTYANDLGHQPLHGSVSISVGLSDQGQEMKVLALLSHQDSCFTAPEFVPFFKIQHHVNQESRLSQSELGTIYEESNPFGFRQFRGTLSVDNSAGLLNVVVQNISLAIKTLLNGMEDSEARGGILLQPLSLHQMRYASARNAGNMLGLEAETKPLMIISVELRHSHSKNDHAVMSGLSRILEDSQHNAARNGSKHTFLYLNYAGAEQKAYEYITESNHTKHQSLREHIRAVRKKYDPDGVFTNQIRDPFRIGI